MKAILEFNLPDEEYTYEHSMKGVNYRIALDEIDEFLRKRLKYEELSETEYHLIDNIRTELRSILLGVLND